MNSRPRPSLMDYMVVAISPALIMAMVGSLLFYLLTIFYHGQYEARLTFIFAMFVMAIVLIARISMEEGIEYASLFAVPLAIVTMVAMLRFVQIRGPLAGYSMIINAGLIALVWWSAHKLTWDCTLIDDDQDSSGEGLLQRMGFDSETVEDQATEQVDGSPARSEEDGDQTVRKKAEKRGVPVWWQRLVDRRHRHHTPGVWVIYYAVAALPLFALGRWLIPAHDTAAHLHAFRLLVVYVASAMGLLLTTSFLGLRRYLRRRKMEMPGEMAGMWLGIGTAMILAVLLFCVMLPRPGAAVAVSQLPFKFGAPEHSRTQRHAPGNDGPERPREATRTRQDASKARPNAPIRPESKATHADAEQQGGQRSAESSADRPTSGDRSQSKTSDDATKPGGSEERRDSEASAKKTSQSSSDRQRAGDNSQTEPAAESPKRPGAPPDSKQAADTAKGAASHRKGRSGNTGAARQEGAAEPLAKSPADQPSADEPQDQQGVKKGQPRAPHAEESRDEKNQSETQYADSRKSPNEGSPVPSADYTGGGSSIAETITGVLGGFAGVLKLLFWAVLIAFLAYFGWKHRHQLLQAIHQLVTDLKSLLARLFGGRVVQEEAAEHPGGSARPPSFTPFSSYHDPFLSGAAARYSTEQLVGYTFQAMEAWARERSCPRDQQDTPLEFARHLATQHPSLAAEAQQLADLYSRIIYGHERVILNQSTMLQHVWRCMRSTAAMPAPPPPSA